MTNVLKISEAASLALHTMVLLVRTPERSISAKELAAAIGRSEFHLAKVLQRLARVGFVNSTRGPNGGFQLAENGESLSLYDVFKAIEGPLEISPCLMGMRFCGSEACVLGELNRSVNRQFLDYMNNRKLKDFQQVEHPVCFQGRGPTGPIGKS